MSKCIYRKHKSQPPALFMSKPPASKQPGHMCSMDQSPSCERTMVSMARDQLAACFSTGHSTECGLIVSPWIGVASDARNSPATTRETSNHHFILHGWTKTAPCSSFSSFSSSSGCSTPTDYASVGTALLSASAASWPKRKQKSNSQIARGVACTMRKKQRSTVLLQSVLNTSPLTPTKRLRLMRMDTWTIHSTKARNPPRNICPAPVANQAIPMTAPSTKLKQKQEL